MNFEVRPNNTGKAKLSACERQILNQAVTTSVLKAALKGGIQITDGPLTSFFKTMFSPGNYTRLDLTVNAELAAVFAEVLEDYARDAQVSSEMHVIALSNQFDQADKLLVANEQRQYIDEQVSTLVIPDNIEGLI